VDGHGTGAYFRTPSNRSTVRYDADGIPLELLSLNFIPGKNGYVFRLVVDQYPDGDCNALQHTAAHCNTLQRAATRCNALRHTATHNNALQCDCNTLQHTTTHCNTLQHTATHCQHTATHCNTLQHTSTHCNTLQHTATYATHCNTRRRGRIVVSFHTATHCNTLQHTATHCNTRLHTATHADVVESESHFVNLRLPLGTHCMVKFSKVICIVILPSKVT